MLCRIILVISSPSSSVYFSTLDTLLSLQFHPSVSCQLASANQIPFAFPPNILALLERPFQSSSAECIVPFCLAVVSTLFESLPGRALTVDAVWRIERCRAREGGEGDLKRTGARVRREEEH